MIDSHTHLDSTPGTDAEIVAANRARSLRRPSLGRSGSVRGERGRGARRPRGPPRGGGGPQRGPPVGGLWYSVPSRVDSRNSERAQYSFTTIASGGRTLVRAQFR